MTDRSVGMHNARDGIASVDIHITYHKMLVVKIGIFFVVRAFREAKRSIQRVIFCRVAYVTSLMGICFDGMVGSLALIPIKTTIRTHAQRP